MKIEIPKMITLILAGCVMAFSSCIKTGSSSSAPSSAHALNAFTFQYKWYDTTDAGTASQKIAYNEATLNNTLVISNDTVYCHPTLPGSFDVDQIGNVSLKHLWAYATISDQAKIAPVGSSPVLGNVGDYSVAQTYVVTAADGSQQSYVIVSDTIPIPLVNKYQGTYQETGYFTHPTSPRALNMTKTLAYVDASTVSCDLADLGTSGYTMTIKVNADNSCDVSEFYGGAPLANSQMVPNATNQYYPSTKTFILNYEYLGASGWRIIADTLKKQ
jgi:hypothetical protein